MFEFLFKYSPVIFSEGAVTFNYLPSLVFLLLMAVAFAVSIWVIYQRTTIELSRVFKGTLIGLKIFAILILLFLLLEPVVTVSRVMPRKSSLIVLVDDSKSMSIKDVGRGKSRQSFALELLGNPDKPGLSQSLKENFKTQMYKFSSDVRHLPESNDLSADGAATDLAKGLEFAEQLGKQTAVSGVVLITDGVDNGNSDPLGVASALKANGLPVFVVGVGSEQTKDVELAKVAANHSVIENSVVELSALIKNKNLEDQNVELELREEGRVIKRQSVILKGSATRASLKFSPARKGFVRYSLTVLAKQKESIEENNSKRFLIDNRSRQARVLYVEGHPRAEFKFIRRALDGDESIDLVSLLRTRKAGAGDSPEAKSKFYRQGVKNQLELQSGYPVTKQDLFKYDAIIFGSIEQEFFNDVQLQNTLEFVSQRGGGFLMLGGSHSFAQGGYSKSVIEKLLPVELPPQSLSGRLASSDKYRLLITPEGYRNAILQLASDDASNRAAWDKLSELAGHNPLGRAKPGATILAVHPLSESQNPKIIMAQQRFGRGRSMAFAAASSWLWQMGMPHQDTSHERFWRQVMRWLALNSPAPIESHLDKDSYVPNEQVTLKIDVRDSSYATINDATIKATIRKPSGGRISVPFRWSSNGAVEYLGVYHPDEEGMYLAEVNAYSASGEFLGKSESAFYVEESKAEFANAHLQSTFLKRIADVSGGKYYHQDEAKDMASEISVMHSSYSKLVDHDLWDMPIWFLLVAVILCVEWYVRRGRGLS